MDIIKTLHVFIFLHLCSSSPAATYLSVVRLGPCRAAKKTDLVTFSEMSLVQQSGVVGTVTGGNFSGKVYIRRDIENGWNVKAVMEKCHDIRNLDTCDFFKADTIVRNGCVDPDIRELENVVFFYISPKMNCPVKSGNYTVTDFPYFTSNLQSAESRISTSVFGYTYSIMGYNEDEERIFCLESHLRLNYVRKHDWTANEITPINPPRFMNVPATPVSEELHVGDPDTVEGGVDDTATDGEKKREEVEDDDGVEDV
ncbi:hypothetical protein NE865_04109 [Phthorimaea operculella]|nr:hypothetical protein NE865_04109 [Phthorimaea operculella]